jgi:hypothetical protein
MRVPPRSRRVRTVGHGTEMPFGEASRVIRRQRAIDAECESLELSAA